MEFKRIREKIEELEYHKNNDSITDKGSELLAELKQALQLRQGGVRNSAEFRTMNQADTITKELLTKP